METSKPEDLTYKQWHLLKYLYYLHSPFYIDDVCKELSNSREERMEFYKMIFWMAFLNYIAVVNEGIIVANKKLNPSYSLTLKGMTTVSKFAEIWNSDFKPTPDL